MLTSPYPFSAPQKSGEYLFEFMLTTIFSLQKDHARFVATKTPSPKQRLPKAATLPSIPLPPQSLKLQLQEVLSQITTSTPLLELHEIDKILRDGTLHCHDLVNNHMKSVNLDSQKRVKFAVEQKIGTLPEEPCVEHESKSQEDCVDNGSEEQQLHVDSSSTIIKDVEEVAKPTKGIMRLFKNIGRFLIYSRTAPQHCPPERSPTPTSKSDSTYRLENASVTRPPTRRHRKRRSKPKRQGAIRLLFGKSKKKASKGKTEYRGGSEERNERNELPIIWEEDEGGDELEG